MFERCSKIIAPIEVAPHTTGAAVDLTLISEYTGKPLTMGCKSATFTNAKNISRRAKYNRSIMIKAMKKAGFINYPAEWWHWSFGDKYWAFAVNSDFAVYGPK